MSAMFPEEIADYLKNNPSFFEQYADLMAQIFVPHPHGGRAVSLAERDGADDKYSAPDIRDDSR